MDQQNSLPHASEYHVPVMLAPCIEHLNIQPSGIYVDVTFGGGGHSKAILEKLGPEGKLYAFDQDPDAWENAIDDPRFTLIKQNFRHFNQMLKFEGVTQVNGILADLGVSSHQFDVADRGFSIRFEGKLDMRMNTKASISAETVINTYGEEQLANILYQYGELRNSRKLAKIIVNSRPIQSTLQFTELIRPFSQGKEMIFLARVFQAIRIEVNQEIEVLKEFIQQATKLLASEGRFVVMSYHSLEDRPVKNWFKRGTFEGEAEKDFFGHSKKALKEITKKPIIASEAEIKLNPRASSAKLRVAEKIVE